MRDFSELQSIELKEGFFAQYFAGKGLTTHPDELPYKIKFNKGIPLGATYWCAENCRHKWGWIFVNVEPHKTIPHCDEAYLLFENETEALLFKLQHA